MNFKMKSWEFRLLEYRHRPVSATCIVIALMWILPTSGLDTSSCRTALGMQSGVIPDSHISGSSAYDPSVSAPNGRIRQERNGGAWCPKSQVTRSGEEYLQIDLGELKVITMVETQGRFGNGQGQEYAEEYEIHYQREEDGPWFKFKNRQGKHVFTGNTNPYIVELRELNPALITRKIRFVPLSEHPKTVCMRVEVYGCVWKDGVISYSMKQGEQRGNDIFLKDETYDGPKTGLFLSGGLGQLTDGVEGHSNFRIHPSGLDVKGYDWIGWRNESLGGKPVEIVLKFDAVRNFSSMRIHCNNLMKKDVFVFKRAEIFFSVGGKYYTSEPIEFDYMRDELIEFARTVIIPLKNSIGRYIKLVLYFDSRWILISEIQVTSENAVGNFTEEVPPTTTMMPSTSTLGHLKEILVRADGNRSSAVAADGHSTRDSSTSSSVEVYGTQGRRHNDDEIIGIVIGILATLILLLFILMVIIIIRQKRAKFLSNLRTAKVKEPHTNGAVNMANITPTASGTIASTSNGKHVSNGKIYSYVAGSDVESDREGTWAKIAHYREPHDSIQHRKLPDLPRTPESTDTNTSREYAIPDMTKSSVIVNIPPPPPPPPRRPHNIYGVNPSMPMDSGIPFYTMAEAVNIQGMSGSNTYAVTNSDTLLKEDFSVMEFPRENLKFIENLGEGQFGEVHLAEATNVTEFLGDDFLVSRTGTSRSLKVVVKMLKKNISDDSKYASCRFDFHREVRIMCRLNHANVVRVLGVCSREDPLCVIVEYMKYGDLNQYLKQHVPENTMARRNKACKTLSNGCLTYMAGQVASGMKYLETLNVVHRDLAARNCLVGHLYTIKISDFGMSRNLYSADYYRIEGKAVLPIRWMAWESVLLGKFSSKSDVWSFGVTLWEILTFAREQPFEELTDEQVIDNCTHYFHGDKQQVYLPQPASCPKEIYDLMRECWNREEADRPAFKEIHMFLQRKSIGYDPKIECRNTLPREKVSIPVV